MLPASHHPNRAVYLDIETASLRPTYGELPERLRTLWEARCEKKEGADPDALWHKEAALCPEFCVVVCVVLAMYENGVLSTRRFVLIPTDKAAENHPQNDGQNRKTHFYEREVDLLRGVREQLNSAGDHTSVVTWNGNGFDYPTLTRRYFIRGIRPPKALMTIGLEPWKRRLVDLMEVWRGSMWSHNGNVSLDLFCGSLGVPSPKENLSGSFVSHFFYDVVGGCLSIADYCEQDVICMAKAHQKMAESYDRD